MERDNHQQLHRQLISIEKRPCQRCGSLDDLELHRLVPRLGYVQDNVVVLCRPCHIEREHYQGKFKVGDKIFLNGRAPDYIVLKRYRPRTIIAIRYNREKECNFYTLGSNGRGACNGEPASNGFATYEFRSYQLHPWQKASSTGRPNTKRGYTRHLGIELVCPDPDVSVLASHKTYEAN